MIFLYNTHAIEYEYSFNNHPITILLLHGWGGNKDSFAKIKKIFKSRYNILSVSLPPYDDTISTLDMYDYREIVLTLLKSLNITNIYIICHSFGLRVSLMLATVIDIKKIVIAGGAGIKLKPNFFKKLTNNFHSLLLKRHPEFFKKFASNDYLNLSNTNRQTFKNIVNKDLTNYINLLKCPAFLFWGTNDTATPIKMFKIFKKLKPDIEYKIIKRGTHFCYLSHSELFVECCDKFLNC
ncbi:MAG: alpha/beta fold hydrolase [Clostridia bacterium]|nr:alpha/beta fold hydrolase [Clostridia bacterium]